MKTIKGLAAKVGEYLLVSAISKLVIQLLWWAITGTLPDHGPFV